jgi:hypothetical protein
MKQARSTGSKNHQWLQLSFFTKWASPNHSILVCTPMPMSLQARIEDAFTSGNYVFSDSNPFWLHFVLLGQIIEFWNSAVRDLVPLVKGVEKSHVQLHANGPLKKHRPNPEYAKLHEVNRYALHQAETLTVALKTLGGMERDFEEVIKTLSPSLSDTQSTLQAGLAWLRFQQSLLSSLQLRAEGYRKRIRDEITLVCTHQRLLQASH